MGTPYFIPNSTDRIWSTLAPRRGELQHLLVADPLHLARGGHHVRVGGVDAVDVGVDLAHVRLERRRHGHRRGVRAAAAEGGDVAGAVDALEARDDRDAAALECLGDGVDVHVADAGARERAVGEDLHLVAEQRHRLAALGVDRHRQQAHRHLLAGGRHHVELALARIGQTS
jgi:2-polyprenyl-6-hydroxyphenyl methylase/3-demethylubiquinone-9 3-methyltransferase